VAQVIPVICRLVCLAGWSIAPMLPVSEHPGK
jgi:hypothetical protein